MMGSQSVAIIVRPLKAAEPRSRSPLVLPGVARGGTSFVLGFVPGLGPSFGPIGSAGS